MKPKYRPILLNPNTNYQTVSDIELDLMDIVILHNACVDILNEFPEMVGYNVTRNKLKKIIDNHKKNTQL